MIRDYGWTDALDAAFEPLRARGLIPARVTVQQRGQCRVVSADGEHPAKVAGRLLHTSANTELPVAGDWVGVTTRGDAATIHAVLPRRTVFERRSPHGGVQVVVANLDQALIATSLNEELNPRRLERYFSAARHSGAELLVVLTKADLCADVDAQVAAVQALAGDAVVLAFSARTGLGLDAVRAQLKPGSTTALLGSSGVGKSTMVNALAGADAMATGHISDLGARGRHTTTHRELIRLPSGALLLDSPGMRELGLLEVDLSGTFEDVDALTSTCRFPDCAHAQEPGCAVQAALADGALEEARWASYQKLQRETAVAARREEPRLKEAARRAAQQRTRAYRAMKARDDGE